MRQAGIDLDLEVVEELDEERLARLLDLLLRESERKGRV